MPPIGSMEVVLSADAAALLTALDRIERRMTKAEADTNKHASGMAASFKRVGAAITAAQAVFAGFVVAVAGSRLIGWFNQAATEVDKLGKAALRLGVSVEDLSALRYAAKESGVEFEKLSTMMSKAGRSIATMVDGGQGVAKLGAINVALTDAAGNVRSIGELLPDIARGIESAGSEAEQLRLAEKFFGRGGGDQFVTWLKESGHFIDGLAENTERARRLGIIFTADQFEKLRAYGDAIGRIDEALLGLRVNILTRVAPALTEMANRTAGAIAAMPEVVERLVAAVRESISDAGGPLGDQLDIVIGDVAEVAISGVKLAVRAGYGMTIDMLKVIWPALRNEFSQGLQRAVLEPLELVATAAAGTIDYLTGNVSMSMSLWVARNVSDLKALVAMGHAAADEQVDIFNRISSGDSTFARQWVKGKVEMSEALQNLIKDGDELLDLTGALGRHAMTGFEVAGNAATEAADKVGVLQERLAEMAEEGNRAISGFSRDASDALADFAMDGKLDLEGLARSWTRTLLSMAAQALIFKPMFEGIGAGFGSFFSQSPSAPAAPVYGPPNPDLNAHGNVYQMRGSRHRAANGMVLNQRTYFPGLNAEAAEAGNPEWAFAPLRRIGGDLGVKSAPPNVNVQVFDQRGSGARPEVSQHTGPDGSAIIRVMVRDELKRAVSDGSVDGVMSSTYGLKRQGARR